MIVVIDYRAGNLYNVGHALKYLKVPFQFSGDPAVVASAEKVILPGVGSARPAMQSLEDQGLFNTIRNLKVPFLGICLGLQLLFEQSEEESTPCLNVLPGTIRKFDSHKVKVPHIGWNTLDINPGSIPLLEGIPSGSFFYFVHSYYAPIGPYTVARTRYGAELSSIVQRGNFWGVQFHPERSGGLGLRLLQNFLSLPTT